MKACNAGFPYWCDPVARRPLTWLLVFIHSEESRDLMLRKKRPHLISSVAGHNDLCDLPVSAGSQSRRLGAKFRGRSWLGTAGQGRKTRSLR